MPEIRIRFHEPRTRGYSILAAEGLLDGAGRALKARFPGHHPFLISSPRVHRLWGPRLEASLRGAGMPCLGRHLVADGERHKTFAAFARALSALAAFGKGRERRPLVVLLGGGVVGDLGGFAAAAYKRGIPFVQVPSTLLAMVDSSVGGKLGVDFDAPGGRIKNLVGAFHQPGLVLIDPGLLSTLPARELRCGLAEALKTALLFDPALFAFIQRRATALLRAEPGPVLRLITACVRHKGRLVQRDEFDRRGERALLNLGHTFGHALESASSFRLLHGEAVALGLCLAVDLSARLGLAGARGRRELAAVEPLVARLGLPTSAPGLSLPAVMKAMAQDKKFEAGLRFVLPLRVGRAVLKDLDSDRDVRRVLSRRIGGPGPGA